jgi:hypothetical protein
MIGSLIVLAALGASSPGPVFPWLELQQHASAKTHAVSLLAPATSQIPRAFDDYLMGDIRVAMAHEISQFTDDVMPRGKAYDAAGSGDDVGGLALLCGLLGFFPGFGIGHAIAGNIGGFVLFLCIDLVIVGVFFIVFPIFYFPFWYLASLVVILVERIVEAFSAANSATRYHGYRYSEWTPSGGPGEHLPGAKPAFTILHF